MSDQQEYLTLQSVLARKWTRGMVDALLGEPDKLKPNPNYRQASSMRLYSINRVVEAEGSADFQSLMAKVSSRRAGKDYTQVFIRRYKIPSNDAVEAAAEALFSLNRYAKHDSCTAKHKTEIYELKNQFIEWSVNNGYLTGWNKHYITQPEKTIECFCVQRGYWGCDRCDEGVYRRFSTRTLEFAVLQFKFNEQYTWHQPKESITFEYEALAPKLEESGDDWASEREKPIELKKAKFAEAKALVRWVISTHNL